MSSFQVQGALRHKFGMYRLMRDIACAGVLLGIVATAGSPAQAQSAVTPPGGGTSGNPYQVSQLGHLEWMRNNVWVTTTSARYYKLMNDIDASSTASWNSGAGFKPINVRTDPTLLFVFDGNHKVIRNLTINAARSQMGGGLFQNLAGGWTVKNLGLENIAVAGGYNSVGGLVGWNEGTLSGCHVTGSVTAGANTLSAVGGLVGWNIGTVRQCFSSGSIRGGGGGGGTVGGLIGYSSGAIVDCFSTATVSGDRFSGGLVGQNSQIGTVTRSYAAGRVTGTSAGTYTGGLIGYVNVVRGGPVNASYWDTQTTGQSVSDGGVGKTTGQMKMKATFAGWNFANVWRIAENMTYPTLRISEQIASQLAVMPVSIIHSAAGASGRTIAVAGNVPWTATESLSWVTITSGSSGTGNGTVTYSVAANAGALRSGTITVSGGGISRTFTINQWRASTTPGVSSEGDFDGDARADMVVFNPATGNWALSFSTGPGWTLLWGWSATLPVPADYDGDGLQDLAVYHPATGNWHIQEGGTGRNRTIQLGFSQTVPVPGDYDNDGKADLAVFHQAAGRWYFQCSTAGRYSVQWGWSTTIPVPADYDGDGAIDIAIYHPASGLWQILKSSTGGVIQKQWGWSTAIPVPADYDNDGKADIAVFHRATGTWRISYSGGGSRIKVFGWSATIPVAADYDGDGAADLAVYHSATGNWHILKSTTGRTVVKNWGWSATKPTLLYPLIHSWFRLP